MRPSPNENLAPERGVEYAKDYMAGVEVSLFGSDECTEASSNGKPSMMKEEASSNSGWNEDCIFDREANLYMMRTKYYRSANGFESPSKYNRDTTIAKASKLNEDSTRDVH